MNIAKIKAQSTQLNPILPLLDRVNLSLKNTIEALNDTCILIYIDELSKLEEAINNATTITGNPKSGLAKLAQVCLHTSVSENVNSAVTFLSKFVQLFVMDSLVRFRINNRN